MTRDLLSFKKQWVGLISPTLFNKYVDEETAVDFV